MIGGPCHILMVCYLRDHLKIEWFKKKRNYLVPPSTFLGSTRCPLKRQKKNAWIFKILRLIWHHSILRGSLKIYSSWLRPQRHLWARSAPCALVSRPTFFRMGAGTRIACVMRRVCNVDGELIGWWGHRPRKQLGNLDTLKAVFASLPDVSRVWRIVWSAQ